MNKEIDINNLNPEFLNEDLQNSIIEYKGRLYINHLLCQNFYKEIEPFAETSNNACVNFQYLTTLKLYRKYLKLKDYDGVLNILEKQKRSLNHLNKNNFTSIIVNVAPRPIKCHSEFIHNLTDNDINRYFNY